MRGAYPFLPTQIALRPGINMDLNTRTWTYLYKLHMTSKQMCLVLSNLAKPLMIGNNYGIHMDTHFCDILLSVSSDFRCVLPWWIWLNVVKGYMPWTSNVGGFTQFTHVKTSTASTVGCFMIWGLPRYKNKGIRLMDLSCMGKEIETYIKQKSITLTRIRDASN